MQKKNEDSQKESVTTMPAVTGTGNPEAGDYLAGLPDAETNQEAGRGQGIEIGPDGVARYNQV